MAVKESAINPEASKHFLHHSRIAGSVTHCQDTDEGAGTQQQCLLWEANAGFESRLIQSQSLGAFSSGFFTVPEIIFIFSYAQVLQPALSLSKVATKRSTKRAQLYLLLHSPQTKQTPGLSQINMQFDPHCSVLPIAFVYISTLCSAGRHREVACIWKQS